MPAGLEPLHPRERVDRLRLLCLDSYAMSSPLPKNDVLQGTLSLLVLKTLASNKRLHGYAITSHIQRVSEDLLRVEEGSLYPALTAWSRWGSCGRSGG